MSITTQPKPISAMIGTIFGGLWALIGALALPAAWHLPAVAAAIIVTLLLVALLWKTDPSSGGGERLFGRRSYQVAVVAEIIAIYSASLLLPRFGFEGYLLQVVGIIVGAHFIGLWVATRSMRFIHIAIGMCALSAVALLLPAAAGAFHIRDLFTGVGNALVLWICASPRRNSV